MIESGFVDMVSNNFLHFSGFMGIVFCNDSFIGELWHFRISGMISRKFSRFMGMLLRNFSRFMDILLRNFSVFMCGTFTI